jgi:NodT family efflux transporter outer membrane factor (OMF) lipoprotein
MNTMTSNCYFALPLCLLLAACSHQPQLAQPHLVAPAHWQTGLPPAPAVDIKQWWAGFNSPQLNQLVAQARADSHDLKAAVARVRQARAAAVVAGASLLPSVEAKLDASQEHLMRGPGYGQLNTYPQQPTYHYFDTGLSARYEVDFWGANAAARDSANHALKASEHDRATVELTLLGSVADSYLATLAANEQARIATLNLANAEQVLRMVRSRHGAGSATALELAQQGRLVAAQQRQLPLYRQQAQDNLIALATLLGQPVQQLHLMPQAFDQLHSPTAAAGVPSELLLRRPDVAAAEARLAAAQADVAVARAAMLPRLTLQATLGTGSEQAFELLRSPFYVITAGLAAPVFNAGKLSAEKDRADARQLELLENYRSTLLNSFAEVEKALNGIDGLQQQRYWQDQELQQAQRAFQLAQNRYQAGADDLLSVLESQRALFQAQDQQVQLRLAQLKASVALYKALGGGWAAPGKARTNI